MNKKEIIKVNVTWCEKNFCATLSDNVPGAVLFTAKNIFELKKEATETLNFHIKGMLKDGEDVPQWLKNGDYEIEYCYKNTAALIHACEPYATIAALSRVTGINQHQLSHYANGVRKPRPAQQRRIIDGMHQIGRELLSIG